MLLRSLISQPNLFSLFILIVFLETSVASVCVVSFWESWGPCVGNCRFALQVRNRDVIRPPFPERLEDGRLAIRPCPVLYQVQTCVLSKCSARSPPLPTDNRLGDGFNSISRRKSLKDHKEIKYEHPNFLKFGASAGAGNLHAGETGAKESFKVDIQGASAGIDGGGESRHKNIGLSMPGRGTAIHERKPTGFNAAPQRITRPPKHASTRFPWHISTNRIVELKGPAGIPETTIDASKDEKPSPTQSLVNVHPEKTTPSPTPSVFLPRIRAPWNNSSQLELRPPKPSPNAVEVKSFGQGEVIEPGITTKKYSGTTLASPTTTTLAPENEPRTSTTAPKVVPKVTVELKSRRPITTMSPVTPVPQSTTPVPVLESGEKGEENAAVVKVPRSQRVFMPKFRILTTIAPLPSITPENNNNDNHNEPASPSTASTSTSEADGEKDFKVDVVTQMPLIVFRPTASSEAPRTSESSSPSPPEIEPINQGSKIAAVHDRPWRGVIKPSQSPVNAVGWNEIWNLKSGDLPDVGGQTQPPSTTPEPTTTTVKATTTLSYRSESTTIRVRTRTPSRGRQPIIRALTRKPLRRTSLDPGFNSFSRRSRRPLTSLRWYEIVRLTSPTKNKFTTKYAYLPTKTTTQAPTTTRRKVTKKTERPPITHQGCGSPSGDPRCCRSTWKAKCPNGRRPQRVVRWSRSLKDRECVPYSYAYCGYEAENRDGRPLKFEEDCYDLCFSEEEKSSLPVFSEEKFLNGFGSR